MTQNHYDTIIIGAGHNRGAKAHCSVHESPFGLAKRVGFSGLPRTEAGL